MRRDLLKVAEKIFLSEFPKGFNDEAMAPIAKKHKQGKMHQMALDMFDEGNFGDAEFIADNITKIIGIASVVSVFEKIKFREFAKSMTQSEKQLLTDGLKEQLHGDREKGFYMFGDVLAKATLFKWPLVTVIPYYYRPTIEAFIKPTTTKNVIRIFELDNIIYKPTPTYTFYNAYRDHLTAMMELVDNSLKPDYAAFTGFLMYAMEYLNNK